MARPIIILPSSLTTNRGFTLIEILIALTIFAVGILALGAIQITSIKTNAVARDVTVKSILAKDLIEHLITLPYSDPALTEGEHSEAAGNLTQANDRIDNDNDGQIDEEEETGFITVQWNVQNEKPVPNTKTIEVTVNRNTVLAGARHVTLTLIKGNL